MPISRDEREVARVLLEDSLANLKRSVADMNPAQLGCSVDGGWTPLGVLSHLYVVEVGIMRRIPNAPPPEIVLQDKDAQLLTLIRNSSSKMEAPERLRPDGRFTSLEELLPKLDRAREISMTWLMDPTVDQRAHAMEHGTFKTLDGYQWLLLIGAHMERHTGQIQRIRASSGFPAAASFA